MTENVFDKIEKLINLKKIREAEIELSKLNSSFYKNSEYLYLRSKIFFINKLYYLALDTLLIALEFTPSTFRKESFTGTTGTTPIPFLALAISLSIKFFDTKGRTPS